jgi:hypothetical protein
MKLVPCLFNGTSTFIHKFLYRELLYFLPSLFHFIVGNLIFKSKPLAYYNLKCLNNTITYPYVLSAPLNLNYLSIIILKLGYL